MIASVQQLARMVYFVCTACQETVKKTKVDSHCGRCRQCWVLVCVDCQQEFEGEDYRSHNQCISEAEKYQGALYRAPTQVSATSSPPHQPAASRSCLTNSLLLPTSVSLCFVVLVLRCFV